MTTQDEVMKRAEEEKFKQMRGEGADCISMWLAGREAGLIEASDKGGYAAWLAFHDGVDSDWGFSDAVTTAIHALLTKEPENG